METPIVAPVKYARKQEEYIKTHAPLVKRIARYLMVRLPQSVQIDDLLQAGMIGLLEAVKHYDESKGAAFETYATIRVRGHMLDEIRNNDWIPRSVHRNARTIAAAVARVENRCGHDARDSEIAAELNLTLDDYYSLLKDAAGSHVFGFDDLGGEESVKGDILGELEPHNAILRADQQHELATIISSLPKNEQMVLALYYQHDLNLKEIGEVLGVSESRVSQIHTQATLRIKARFQAI